MQLSAQILQTDWHALLGWALIAGGLALAVHTLVGIRRPRSGAAHILRAYRPADWSASQPAGRDARPMGSADQWQRLAAIVERGFVHSQTVVALQARAALELEAVDYALSELLAAWSQDTHLLPRPEEAAVAPAPIAQPMAA